MSGSVEYFDNVMMRFIVNNRAATLKTDINFHFSDNKLSNCPLLFIGTTYKLQIHVSVCSLTIKISQ